MRQSITSTKAEPSLGPNDCKQCVHLRRGHSVARTAFDVMLESLKPQLNATYVGKLRTEQEAEGNAIEQRQSNIDKKLDPYDNRPLSHTLTYCGVDEFDGLFYTHEVKNGDGRCAFFVAQDSTLPRHMCKSCRYHRQPSSKLFQIAEQVAGSDPRGQPIRDQIRQVLQSQAEAEYETCVDSELVGIMSSQPGLLPVCEAYSTFAFGSEEGRYVVGPVVNAGEACERWDAGENDSVQSQLTELNTLVERATRAVQEDKWPSDGRSLLASKPQRQGAAANRQADVIEYCLVKLGVDQTVIDSICSQYTLQVWFTERTKAQDSRPTSSLTASSPTTEPGAQRPQEFQMSLDETYSHPRVQLLWLSLHSQGPYFIARVVSLTTNDQGSFDLSRFQPGVWTQLTGQSGPLPIALLATGAPLHQFHARWL